MVLHLRHEPRREDPVKTIVDPAIISTIIAAVLCAVVLVLTTSRRSYEALRLNPIRRNQHRFVPRTHSYASDPTIPAIHKGLSCPTHNPKQIQTHQRQLRS